MQNNWRDVRKHTIRAWNRLQTRDRVLGIRPTSPPKVIHHPRWFNKPLACQVGKHKWFNEVLMGIPILKCRKCGTIAVKGAYEHTETDYELRHRHVPKPIDLRELEDKWGGRRV